MLTIETIKNNAAVGLINGSLQQFQQLNVDMLATYFPAYSYRQFRQESNRATKPLAEVEQLLAYQAFYGIDHFNRFQHLLQQLPVCHDKSKTIHLKVYDYGCGQGLATLAFLQHLIHKNQPLVLSLYLVEPSESALALALYYVQTFVDEHMKDHSIQVAAYASSLDALDAKIFSLYEQQWAVHLFSNILDMADCGLYNLAPLVKQWHTMHGKQLCLAVSPDCLNAQRGFQLIQQQIASIKIHVEQDFTCSSRGYRIYTQHRGMQHYSVKGKMLAFTFNSAAAQMVA